LRNGPRRGGGNRDEIVDHVLETAYASKLGVRRKQPAMNDIATIEELRERSPS
jgi:hypothetical protein